MLLGTLRPRLLPLTRYEQRRCPVTGVVEEGLLEYLFSVLPPRSRFCIEIGAGDGTTNSVTRNLIENHGWSGLVIEADAERAVRLLAKYESNQRVKALQSFVTVDNIEALLREGGAPAEPDFMSIDIDGMDLWLWNAIHSVRPRVVCIEYNASFGPGQEFVVDCQPDFRWSGDDYMGAALKNLVALGREKGYELIHCTAGGDNAFFVVREEFASLGIADNSVKALYQLPQYGRRGRARNGKGHPASRRNSSAGLRLWWSLRYYLLTPVHFLARSLHLRAVRRLQAADGTSPGGPGAMGDRNPTGSG